MQLIVDSGSTKTEWLVVENSRVVKQIFTKGINPFYQTESEIKSEIECFLLPELGDLPPWNFGEIVSVSIVGLIDIVLV